MVADVTIVGSGVIALSCAIELADRGLRVRLIGTAHHGEASPAAGGMLAPSVERELDETHEFAVASRDLYPEFLARLAERTGIRVPANALGILEVATSPERLERIVGAAGDSSVPLDAAQVLELEPALTRTVLGGVLHPHDGAVDPLGLMDALRAAVAAHDHVSVVREDVRAVRSGEHGAVTTTDGDGQFESELVLLAAGAWTPLVSGIAPLPIQPVRGQMIALDTAPLARVVYGERGYLIPRHDGHTVSGSTMEHAGFEPTVTDDAVDMLREQARRTAPAFGGASIAAAWAGLRPVTPDLRPILGRDPERPRLVYACGHSRNGILLTPITASVIADLVTGCAPRFDLTRFRVDRFPG